MKKEITKLWKVMKICATQAMIAMIVCGVSAAHDSYAQLLDKKVTLSLKEVSLEVALKEIASETGVKIFYSLDQLKITESISIEAKDETLRVVLDDLLGPYDIKYKVNEKKSAIILKRQTEFLPRDESLNTQVPATEYAAFIVTGRVLDAVTRQPMAGVNIIVRGTTIGTTTDSEGNYSIQVEDNDVLVFSFIGYTGFETQVSGRNVIDVSLEEDVASLKEVVVNAGYWEVKEREQTGNIVRVDSKEIEKQPVSNPIAALQAIVPGLQITQATGVPGGNFTVRIRGQNSIGSGNDPLYIIDGVPFTSASQAFNETSGPILIDGTSPLNTINPSDIESIEVLKDADATAIYGSRGANGVILITTRKGKTDGFKIDFNLYSGASKVTRMTELLNTNQYVEMRNEAYKNDGINPSGYNARDLLQWDTISYTDWQKVLIGGTAHITDTQISISGGDTNTHFLFGGGFHKETTVFPGDNSDQRGSTHFNLNTTSPNKKLKAKVSVSYSIIATDLLRQDLTRDALSLSPNAPELYDSNAELNWSENGGTWVNPLSILKTKYEANTSNLIGNTVLSYSILQDLEIKTSLGYTNMNMKAVTTIPNTSYNPDFASAIPHSTYFSHSAFQTWIIEPQLSWKKAMGASVINALIGTTFQNQETRGIVEYGEGFASEALMKDIKASSYHSVETSTSAQYRYNALFGRINYVLKDKYILNLTGRRDGSSRFGPSKQFANFGSIGFAWLFFKESFVKNTFSILSFGKLRGSFGVTGNDQLGDYNYLDTYTSSGLYQGNVGLGPVRLSNPNFAWEKNEKIEGGLELGFVKDHIILRLCYYHNQSSDQLVGFALPPTTGFTNIQGNFPATVRNTGTEIEINTINIGNSNFTWTTALNLTIPKNELIDFPNLESSPDYSNRLVVGKPLSIQKVYGYAGINPTTGIYQFDDVNNDGVLNNADRTTIKFVGQQFYGGLNNTFKFKGFQFDILFQFVKQTGYNPLISNWGYPGSLNNQHISVLNRWQEEGSNSEVQKFTSSFSTAANAYYNLGNSNKAIFDTSFIRLKNVSLSYSMPENWVQKLQIQNARIFIQGQNILTITSYEGLDPESQQIVLPPLRTITGGIHLTF